ncbi:hypothetical protein ABT369_25700 [Dactylosporangium sp. NPDC000244]|uniref:hypothetical protein n=1 Tax=Dactylosporangium sp. NPDC000244 TaxID=3154365 RepID=UPI003327CF77
MVAAEPDRAARAARLEAMTVRGEFVRAYTEHLGPRPASELSSARLPTLLTVAALTAAGALVVGVFWQMLSPRQGKAVAAGTTAASATAVAGWGCRSAGDRGFEAHGRTAQWLTVPGGGWSDGGCNGTFQTIPASGQAGADDPGQFAMFWFAVPSAVECAIEVYVPQAPDAGITAIAAHYAVHAGRGGTAYAEFVLDQTARRGQWVAAGSFPVKPPELAVRITNRGPDGRIAVSQVRVTCGSAGRSVAPRSSS